MKTKAYKCFAFLCALILSAGLALDAGAEEEKPADNAGREAEEQGVQEIQQLAAMTEVEGTEGMGLEELTEAISDKAMSDYYDRQSGFSMQYPAIFIFDEDRGTSTAYTADGKASITIESMPVADQLSEDMLIEAIRMESPDAEPKKYEENGCLRVDRSADEGKTCQTDLYLITKKSFHHVILRYPESDKETYNAYIEYIVNTMATESSEQG